jgi:hypothetical protein
MMAQTKFPSKKRQAAMKFLTLKILKPKIPTVTYAPKSPKI